MMPEMKARQANFPLLVWEDHDGSFTARTLDGEEAVAVGKTARKAVGAVKQYLLWREKTRGEIRLPDFGEPELCFVPVSVRPAYRLRRRNTRHYDRPLSMRIPAAVGQREDGWFTCVLPTLDVPTLDVPTLDVPALDASAAFQCESRRSVDKAVQDHARQILDGMEPRKLSRFLMARRYRLDSVTVRLSAGENERQEPALPTVRAVAETLAGKSLRRRFAGVWQRDEEIENVAGRLRRAHANLLLVGEGGVGKTAVLVAAIRRLELDAPSSMAPARARFWLTSGARLIGGMQYLGQWQERCEAIIEELDDVAGVLCIDSLLGLVRAGGRDPSSGVAAFFAPYLARGELRMVAEATPEELDACQRLTPGFMSLFQIVRIESFDAHAAQLVLHEVAKMEQRNARVECAAGVAATVRHLFRRFMPYHPFPGRSVGFVRELFAKIVKQGAPEVTVDHVIGEFVRRTGLPEILLRDELPLEPDAVRHRFEGRICGQPAACDAVTRLVTRFKAGLNDPRRPLGVMLFCGPTGVGKTALARTLADYLFGGGGGAARLVRLDMSEFAGPGAARRLVLQPDGEPSELIRRIRAQPFCVVLLDEIEKAAADVFDMLLGMFDEGRLTDDYGRVATFRSAVIVMTSNLGAGARRPVGWQPDTAPSYESEAYAFFRPEFFNRFDEVVTFNALDTDAMVDITRLELKAVARREGLLRRGLRLEWSDALVRSLAERGLDARYGARFLQRTISQEVVFPLSRWLIGQAGLRDANVRLVLEDDGTMRRRVGA